MASEAVLTCCDVSIIIHLAAPTREPLWLFQSPRPGGKWGWDSDPQARSPLRHHHKRPPAGGGGMSGSSSCSPALHFLTLHHGSLVIVSSPVPGEGGNCCPLAQEVSQEGLPLRHWAPGPKPLPSSHKLYKPSGGQSWDVNVTQTFCSPSPSPQQVQVPSLEAEQNSQKKHSKQSQ